MLGAPECMRGSNRAPDSANVASSRIPRKNVLIHAWAIQCIRAAQAHQGRGEVQAAVAQHRQQQGPPAGSAIRRQGPPLGIPPGEDTQRVPFPPFQTQAQKLHSIVLWGHERPPRPLPGWKGARISRTSWGWVAMPVSMQIVTTTSLQPILKCGDGHAGRMLKSLNACAPRNIYQLTSTYLMDAPTGMR